MSVQWPLLHCSSFHSVPSIPWRRVEVIKLIYAIIPTRALHLLQVHSSCRFYWMPPSFLLYRVICQVLGLLHNDSQSNVLFYCLQFNYKLQRSHGCWDTSPVFTLRTFAIYLQHSPVMLFSRFIHPPINRSTGGNFTKELQLWIPMD